MKKKNKNDIDNKLDPNISFLTDTIYFFTYFTHNMHKNMYLKRLFTLAHLVSSRFPKRFDWTDP